MPEEGSLPVTSSSQSSSSSSSSSSGSSSSVSSSEESSSPESASLSESSSQSSSKSSPASSLPSSSSSLPPSSSSSQTVSEASVPPSETSESSEPETEPSSEESGSGGYEVSGGYIVIRAKNVKDADEFLGDVEREIIDLVNEEREYEGLDPLDFNETLRTAARVRSKELLLNDHFDHTRPDGRKWQTVFEDAVPMSYHMAGENLATITMERGYKNFTAEDWMELWMNSDSHRENILRPEFTHIGVGIYFERDDDTYTAYATQLFATY